MYVKIDVTKPGDNKGVGGDKKATISIFDWDDVATMPNRDASGIAISGTIAMNSGAYMHWMVVMPLEYSPAAFTFKPYSNT